MAKLSAYSSEEFIDLFRRGFSVADTGLDSPGFIYKLSVKPSETLDSLSTLSWSRYLAKDKLTVTSIM